MKPPGKLPRSKHFEIVPLSAGVYVALSSQKGAAICNAGLIDLGNRTLIFDTFLTPQAAIDLKNLALITTGRYPELVINSHYHNDHIWGNQVFAPEAVILSSNETRRLINTAGMEEYDWYKANAESELETLQAKRHSVKNKEDEEKLAMWLGYYHGLVEAFPFLEVHLPDLTFPDRFTIYGNERRVELYTYAGGHTGSDTILYLPEERLLFASDLLFVQSHPYLPEGDPFKLLEILEALNKLAVAQIVPGHGPIGTKDDLTLLIRYITECIEMAEQIMVNGNTSEDDLENFTIPKRYQNWDFPSFFQSNLRFLIKRSTV